MNYPSPIDELDNPKKPRASRPKVKTGCLTCKKRRVKCDESKPACLRCSNFGRICEGYRSTDELPELPAKPVPVAPVIRKLLSKPPQASKLSLKAPTPPPSVRPITQSLLPLNISQETADELYISFFRDYTTINLSGGFGATLWSMIIPQACKVPSIRQLVIATGAPGLASNNCCASHLKCRSDDVHRYALQQYGEALAGLQATVAAGQESLRIAMISALLIIFFENLHGDLGRAIMQIQNVIDVVVSRIDSDPGAYYFPRSKNLFTQRQGEIEPELLTAFIRLDRPTLELSQRKKCHDSLPNQRIFTSLFGSEQLDIPSDFADTTEAMIYLEDVIFRVFPACRPPQDSMFHGDETMVILDFSSVPTRIIKWYRSAIPNLLNTGLSLKLARWYDAFSPLLNHAMTPAGDSTFIAAVIVHIRALAMDLLVSGIFSSPFSALSTGVSPRAPTVGPQKSDMFPIVNAFLSFSRRLVAHPDFHKGFVFDVGFIPWIVEVLVLCPDRGLKEQAVEVLRSMVPRREGIWDSRTIVAICDEYLKDIDAHADLGQIDFDPADLDIEMIDPRLMFDDGLIG